MGAPREPGRGAAVVPDRVQLRKRHLDRSYADGSVHVTLSYPEVIGLRDTALQARINRTIRSAYPPPHGLQVWLDTEAGGDAKHGEVDELDGDYQIELNRDHLLSIQFYGLENLFKNDKPVTAHPYPHTGAVTLDTRTGHAYKLSDLFTGPAWRERLEQLIARAMAREQRLSGAEEAGFIQFTRDDLKSHQYLVLPPRA